MSTFQSIKGTKDLLPADSHVWQSVESVIHRVMAYYRYREIRTPIFEDTALFARGIGEDTDIVGKEMYTFTDKGGSSLTLRPEMTAPVMRSWLQHNLGEQQGLTKVYYLGPMFRQERPQAGRLRQFHQFGCECIGQQSALCDVDVIAVAHAVFSWFGLPTTLKINSVGDAQCRPAYRQALQAYLRERAAQLTEESRRRMETNPLRVLDSKAPQDRDATESAPKILDYLNEDCRTHFDTVLRLLGAINIPFVVDSRLVRGLDYYSKTAFEFVSEDLGAQDALGGGGRYDGLAETVGGPPVPAVGFAAGMERLMMILDKRGVTFPPPVLDLYGIGLDPDSRMELIPILFGLRQAGWAVDFDTAERSFKAQMRDANRQQARFVLILGEEERTKGIVLLKKMGDGTQQTIPLAEALTRVQDSLGPAPSHEHHP